MQVKGETSVNKLILLFVFDKMESPLSERTLVDMCTSSNDWLNYMDCTVLIHKLKRDGFICDIPSGDDPLYSITTEGRRLLANYYISIPKEFTRRDLPLYQTKRRKIPHETGMQVGLLSEQRRHLYGQSENFSPDSAHARAQICGPR